MVAFPGARTFNEFFPVCKCGTGGSLDRVLQKYWMQTYELDVAEMVSFCSNGNVECRAGPIHKRRSKLGDPVDVGASQAGPKTGVRLALVYQNRHSRRRGS